MRAWSPSTISPPIQTFMPLLPEQVAGPIRPARSPKAEP